MQRHEELAQKFVMENAISYRDHSEKDVEYILFYEIKTKKLISCHTDFSKNMAGVHTNIKELLAQDKKLALHHNHPTGKNLSTGDYKVMAQFPNITEIWAHSETGNPGNPYRYFKAIVADRELLNAVLPGISANEIDERNLTDFTWALKDVLVYYDIIEFETDCGTFTPNDQNFFSNAKAVIRGIVKHKMGKS